jgi:hypothetical protein
MALTPADDDPYMQEVKKLLQATRALGYRDAQMLFGSKELYLEADGKQSEAHGEGQI